MSEFLAFSDESGVGDPQGTFLMGGYVAPQNDRPYFVEAWQERVLDGPPKLPYLHMTEIRSNRWRRQYGISYNDAEERISEAVRVLFSSGGISAIGAHVRRDDLKQTIQQPILNVGKNEPDYLCYIAYASFLLDHLRFRYPEVKKVNFVVSKKARITHHIRDFHRALKTHIGTPLDKLVGNFIPGDMESQLPLQAADVLCWHMQRYFSRKMNRVDENRLWCLGETCGICHEITREELDKIAHNI